MALSRTENTIKNTGAALVSQIVAMVARFAIQTVFIYTLGEQYTGVAGVFTDILQILAATELGVGTAVMFSLYGPLKEKDADRIAGYINLLRRVCLLVAGVILTLGIILMPFLGYIVKDVPDIREDLRVIFLLFVVKTAISYLFHYRFIMFEADQQRRVLSQINSVVTLCITVLQIGVLYIWGQYYIFLGLDILSVLISNLVGAYIYRKKYAFLLGNRTKLPVEDSRKVWKNVGNLCLYRGATTVLNATDSIIISTLLNTGTVGILVGYRMLINYVYNFAGQFFHSATPSVGNSAAAEALEHNYRLFGRMSFIQFSVTHVTSTCLYVMLIPFVNWWLGPEFGISPLVVGALVLNYYTAMMMITNTTFRNVYGLFSKHPEAPVFMALINVVLSIVMGIRWGIFGIMIATSIARFATLLWVDPLLVYRNVFHKDMKGYWTEFLLRLGMTICSCGIAWGMTKQIPYGFGMLFVRLIIALVVAGIILWLRYRRSEELAYVWNKMREVILKVLRRDK